jgi:hypothetical protein
MKSLVLLVILAFPWMSFAKERVADGEFRTLTAVSAAPMVGDVERTQRCLDLGTCLEGNPLMPSSRAKVYAVQVPVTIGRTYFAYRRLAKERAADGKFWALTAASAGLMVADIEGTQRCLRSGTCREGNPLMPSSRAKVYAVQVPITVGITYLAYRLKKAKCAAWWLPHTALIGAHGIGFTLSLRF